MKRSKPGDTRWTKAAGYPSFAPLFKRIDWTSRIPAYMMLMCPGPPERDFYLQIALYLIRRAISRSPNITAEVVALFDNNRELRFPSGWRSHLVGAVAILAGAANTETLRALWKAFDKRSWVTPQLAVAAFHCDSNFENEARRRIEAGSAHRASEECKALNALVALARQYPGADGWLDSVLANDEFRQYLKEDWDRGDNIALLWQQNVSAALKIKPLSFWGYLWHKWRPVSWQ